TNLLVNVTDMVLHGLSRDAEQDAYLRVGLAARYPGKDLCLAVAEASGVRRGGRRCPAVEKRLDDPPVQPSAAYLIAQDTGRGLCGMRRTVRTDFAQRRRDVGDREDARGQVQRRPGEATVIAGTVQTLAGRRGEHSDPREIG